MRRYIDCAIHIPVLFAGSLLAGYTDRGVAYTIDLSELKRVSGTAESPGRTGTCGAGDDHGGALGLLAHELMQPLDRHLEQCPSGAAVSQPSTSGSG